MATRAAGGVVVRPAGTSHPVPFGVVTALRRLHQEPKLENIKKALVIDAH